MTVHDFLQLENPSDYSLDVQAATTYAERYLAAEQGSQEQISMAAALTVLLDDPARPVRKAVAKVLAKSPYAPGHVIRCLATDVDEISVLVLKDSPVFSDSELVDLLAQGSEASQCAIAQRAHLSASVSAALCEVGAEAACRELLQNKTADVLQTSLLRLAERFEESPALCDLLLKSKDLPLATRYELLMRLADSLETHPVVLERIPEHQRTTFLSDAGDKVILRLAYEASDSDLPDFVEHLRANAKLNTRLLLRAVCCGRLRFFAASLANLGSIPLPRARKLLLTVRRAALQAMLRKAGLPYRSHEAFLLAIDIAREANADFTYDLALDEARVLTETLLSVMQDGALGADDDVTAFLRRFAIDVARLEARQMLKATRPGATAAA
ncbi:DUF2336 domain-containing protein [Roseibium denhamense]|uniref:Uncharacterized conserved protein, DUF2336 family n=1 Tax=Roseibium denhamense TaxID=76305 RepID=A0ABY1N5X3_9HYPH|nr:DUF2336 domain-containing protein [Roseibium denhamense]MTI04624.1 DUF2336 domain-containing protein [Roseibium denhamense]SMP00498.1 Uncharacterized conserved protein, DUF2336 family [Roseibium denhamense]